MSADIPETFSFSRELGLRLRELRIRAGLTQADVAGLMGRKRVQVTRLEGGHNPNPKIGLVADYLRAVQAHFDDLSDLLRKYTSLPRPVEVETRSRVVEMLRDLPTRPQKQADSYDIKTSLAIRFGKKPRTSTPTAVSSSAKRSDGATWPPMPFSSSYLINGSVSTGSTKSSPQNTRKRS